MINSLPLILKSLRLDELGFSFSFGCPKQSPNDKLWNELILELEILNGHKTSISRYFYSEDES